MARLLRYIHPHVSRYAQVDVPCRQAIIRRNRVELFLAVTLKLFAPTKRFVLLYDNNKAVMKILLPF